jgi:hypothetical protein
MLKHIVRPKIFLDRGVLQKAADHVVATRQLKVLFLFVKQVQHDDRVGK